MRRRTCALLRIELSSAGRSGNTALHALAAPDEKISGTHPRGAVPFSSIIPVIICATRTPAGARARHCADGKRGCTATARFGGGWLRMPVLPGRAAMFSCPRCSVSLFKRRRPPRSSSRIGASARMARALASRLVLAFGQRAAAFRASVGCPARRGQAADKKSSREAARPAQPTGPPPGRPGTPHKDGASRPRCRRKITLSCWHIGQSSSRVEWGDVPRLAAGPVSNGAAAPSGRSEAKQQAEQRRPCRCRTGRRCESSHAAAPGPDPAASERARGPDWKTPAPGSDKRQRERPSRSSRCARAPGGRAAPAAAPARTLMPPAETGGLDGGGDQMV